MAGEWIFVPSSNDVAYLTHELPHSKTSQLKVTGQGYEVNSTKSKIETIPNFNSTALLCEISSRIAANVAVHVPTFSSEI